MQRSGSGGAFLVAAAFGLIALTGCGGASSGSNPPSQTTPTITWAAPAAITVGTALSSIQLDATASVAGTFVYSPAAGTIESTAGTVTLSTTFTPTDATDYTTATGNVSLVVNAIPKTTPTITWAAPAAVGLGTALSSTQLDATASVAGTFVYSPATGTVESAAGTVTLGTTFTPTDTTDYNTATASVQLTVNKATPTVSWTTPSAITAGTALSATQLDASASIPGTFAYSPALGTIESSVGSITLNVTFTPTDAADYNSATGSVSLTVNKGTPAITWATPSAVTVGGALSATQLDATASVPGTFVYSPTAGTVESSAGTVTLSTTFTPTDTTDYNTATGSVSLTISKATPIVTWSTPAAITAGAALSGTQLDATASVAGTFVYSPAAGTVESTAGTVTLNTTFTPTDTSDYTTATGSVSLTVNATPKTNPIITWATPASISAGTALSATQLNATASVAGTFVYSPALGTVESSVGTVTLNTTFTPTDTTDYNTVTSSVQLSVTQGTPAITWATPAAITAGTALSTTQLDATASVPGKFVYSPAAGTVESSVGTVTLNTTFTPTDTTDYTTATGSVQLTVNQGTPIITWATPAAIVAGTALSSTQLDATASVPGSFVYSPASGTVESAAGTVSLNTTFTPTDTTDYTTATATVQLTVDSASGGTPNYSWSNVQIVAGGYIPGTYFHPTSKGLMYVRTDVGGVYRMGPNDTQWVPLMDFTARNNWWNLAVEAIGLDPTNDKRLYIATGAYALESWDSNGQFLISNNQGASFITVNLPFMEGGNDQGRNTGDRITVDPNDTSLIYFGTRLAGLQMSTNHGLTWSQVTGVPVTAQTYHINGSTSSGNGTANGIGVVQIIPMTATGTSGSPTPVVYTAVSGTGTGTDPMGLYVSTNAGSASSTWTAVSGQPTGLAVLRAYYQPLNSELYVLYGDQAGPGSMNSSQLWKFVPTAGTWTSGTWTQITLPNPDTDPSYTEHGFSGLAIDPQNPGVLLVATLDQYSLYYDGQDYGDDMFRSTDDGATWEDIGRRQYTSVQGITGGGGNHDGTLSPWLGFGGGYANVGNGNWATGLSIDPFNADHAMYGTGQTLWSTTNLTSADTNTAVNWTVGAQGIEETVVTGLWAPPSGKTILLSGLGDISGFAHQNLSVSPPQEMYSNPQSTPASIDFEQNTPTAVFRTSDGSGGTKPIGSYSTDGGVTWTAFATNPAKSYGGGQIAVAPDGSSLVWSTEDTTSVWYSTNNGQTWTASSGIPAQAQVVSDRVKAGVYYGLSGTTLYLSTNSGASWTSLETGLPNTGDILYSLPDAQGDIILAASYSGLYVNQGTATAPNLVQVSSAAGVQDAYHIGFGASIGSSTKITLFLDGQVSGTAGIFRSVDGGNTWIQINDSSHQYSVLNGVTGDMRTPGTIYLATPGRGIIWGTSPN